MLENKRSLTLNSRLALLQLETSIDGDKMIVFDILGINTKSLKELCTYFIDLYGESVPLSTLNQEELLNFTKILRNYIITCLEKMKKHYPYSDIFFEKISVLEPNNFKQSYFLDLRKRFPKVNI